MRVLLTGKSGFLGSIIYKYLKKDNTIYSLGRRLDSDIVCDLSNYDSYIDLPNFDMLIHCASLAHKIPKTKEEISAFFDLNVNGTRKLLKNISYNNIYPKYLVYISSVSVYGLDHGNYVNEDFPLLAKDPYGLSKIEAEKEILKWSKLNKVGCTILRLPLLIGQNPKGNLLKMINGIKKGFYFNIDGGRAKKSMVLAEDVAKIIVKSAKIGGVYNLTDAYHPNFNEISKLISEKLELKMPYNINFTFAKILSFVGDIFNMFPFNSRTLNKMTNDLTFCDKKAFIKLGWKPKKVIENYKL